ncbi:MAG: hypothetical protein ACQET1_00140, partial [Gemmatimonadota bacterium]
MKERGLKALRGPIYRITDPLVKGMIRAGIHPNAITTMGFVVTLMSGWFFHLDHVRTAGVFVLLGGL